MIGKKVGNYEIKSKLGEGGMGAVYLGEHPMIGKRVAIKVLLEEFASNEVVVSRFFNEAKAVNDIGHQNIVDIIDFGKIPTEDGSSQMVYFVMELLNGESLADRIKRLPLTAAETRHVIEQCCDALNASHAKGIVHRDLKPDNIFLTVRGQDKAFVKILDFGIAKLTGAGGANNKTQTGTVIGTPHYMSPEQCAGKGQIDHRSDIYSLGCVMYELATGHLPFPGEGFGDILIAHLIREPPKPSEVKPDVDPVLEQVIIKSMIKDREQRWPSMAEMGAAVAGNKDAAGGDFKFQPLFADEPSKANKLLQDVPGSVSKPGYNTFDKKSDAKPEEKKKITTLSGAASEMEAGGRSKAGSIAAVAAVMLVIGSVGGYFALRGNSTTSTPPAAVVTPPPPKPIEKLAQPIEIKISSVPAGAMVMRADQAEGPRLTPAIFRLKEGDPSFDVSIKLNGYKVQTRTINPDVSKTIEIVLAKDEAVPAVVAPTGPTAPIKKKKKVDNPSDDDMKTLAPVF